MLIRSLQVENYRVIRSAGIMLPETVIGIIGPNGAGKTSLIEAIAWAFYGTTAARSGKDEIASELAAPDEPCRVTVTFDIHGTTYVVERRLVGRSRRAEATVTDAAGVLLATGVSDTGAFVARLLGLDLKGFLTSFLARQQELNAFSDLVPSKRREHLATLLGVDRLDQVIADLRSDSRVHQAEIGVLQQNLEHRSTLKDNLEQLHKRLNGLQKARDDNAGARDLARSGLDAASTAFKAEQVRKDECSVLEASLQGARSSLKHLQERQLQLEHEASELLTLVTRAAKLKSEIAPIDDLRRQRELLADLRKHTALREELDRQTAELTQRRDQTILQKDELTRQLNDVTNRLNQLPANLPASLAELEDRLEKARGQYTETTAALRAVQTDRDRLTERLNDMQAVGESATCDRCGRAFGGDLPTIREHFRAEVETCAAEIARLSKQQGGLRESGEQLAAEVRSCRQQLDQQRELQHSLESGRARLTEHSTLTTDLEAKLQAAADKRAGLPADHFDQAAFDTCYTELTRLEKLATEHHQLLGRLERRQVVADEQAKTRTAVGHATDQIRELEQRKAEIGFDPARFELLAQELQKAQTRFDQVSGQAAESERELQLAAREAELTEKQLAEFAEIESRLEQTRETAFYGERLQNLVKQFRSSVIANIRPSLAAISSRLMADMTDGRYSLLKLDDQYNLQVMDNGRFFPIERFSGGEKDLANLCLRLAISQALTEAAGIDSAFVILDEIFGSQDDGRRELIFDALAGLKRRFAQIILVTHIEDIKNRVECLIEVRPGSNGWSEVIVHG